NGGLDPSFGGGGKVLSDFGNRSFDVAYGLAIQKADGKIVLAGVSDATSSTEGFALARYRANWALDTGFGTSGKMTTDFRSAAHGIVVKKDGKVVVGGFAAVSGGGFAFALVRYRPNGALDSAFGSGGKVTTKFNGSAGDDVANAVALQADGKIVLAGYSAN